MPRAGSTQVRHGLTSLAHLQSELAMRIKELTDNGSEVVNFFLGILRDPGVNVKARISCGEWLANRMWGREPEIIHLTTNGVFEGILQATEVELKLMIRGEMGDLPDVRQPNVDIEAIIKDVTDEQGDAPAPGDGADGA